MATERMYELAFQYRQTKLWKQMSDSELFAVRLSDGEIGYCCVMGMAGEHIALALYVGDEGFQSFRDLAFRERDEFSEFPTLSDMTWALRQSCLQCSFENKDELEEWEAEAARKYAKAHKIPLRGAHSYPNFTKYARYRMPGGMENPEDERRICEALAAAVALSGLLEAKGKAEIGLYPADEETETLPLLTPGKDGYEVGETEVPEEWEEVWPEPVETDAESVAELRKLRKKGVYACEVLRFPGLVEGQTNNDAADDDEPPYFPVILLCLDTKSGYLTATEPVADYDARPESLRDAFAQMLIRNGECPRAVKARNEQTRVLLRDLCIKTGILLSVDDELPALDDAEEEFLHTLRMGGGNIFDDDDDDDGDDLEFGGGIDMGEAISVAMDEMMRMSDRELREIPPMVVRQILDMAPYGFVPQELQLRLRRLFKKL
ncbi:MAG: hypothetical protein IKN96_09230 [Oscillibacter sp.]|nr:hypothetical protein [Oscillibacter sp.]